MLTIAPIQVRAGVCLTIAASVLISPPTASDRILLTIEDLNRLYDLVKEVSTNWYNIGLKLSFKVGELKAIQSIPILIVEGPEGYLMELLCRWLKRTSPPPYLQDLAKAIHDAGNERLGTELAVRFSTTTNLTKGTSYLVRFLELDTCSSLSRL